MNFVIKRRKKLKTGPLTSSKSFMHLWTTTYSLQSSKNCGYLWILFCTHGGQTHANFQFADCQGWQLPGSEVLGAIGSGSGPVRRTTVRHSPGMATQDHGNGDMQGQARRLAYQWVLAQQGQAGQGCTTAQAGTGRPSTEGSAQGLWLDLSCDHPAALPGGLSPPPLAGWGPPLAALALRCPWAPKTKPVEKARHRMLSGSFQWLPSQIPIHFCAILSHLALIVALFLRQSL